VPRRLRSIVAGCVLAAVALAANEMSDMVTGQAAMVCCAKTDYSCAGLSAPDTCCRRMHHASSHATPSTAAAAHSHDGLPAATLLPSAFFVGPTRGWERARLEFKRPHDPPHLHTYSLLI